MYRLYNVHLWVWGPFSISFFILVVPVLYIYFFFIWKKCSFLKPWKNRAINYNEEKFSTIFHNMVSTNEVRLISWRGISTPRSYVRLISKCSRKISWIRTTSLLSQKGAFYSIWVDQMLRVDRVKKSFSVNSYFPEFSVIYFHERFNW